MADQGIVSAGNFATTALMVASLQAQEFARFGICFEVMCYLNSLQTALITYPLTIRGTAVDDSRLRKLATGCLILTLLFAPVAIVGMTIATALLEGLVTRPRSELLHCFQLAPWAIAAILTWQAQETTRRTLICKFRYRAVFPGDALSYLGQAIIMLILAQHGELTLKSAFASMAITSTLACVLQSLQIGVTWVKVSELRALAVDFWAFGRWSLCSSLSTAFTDFSFSWLLTAHSGLNKSAAFQVMGNLSKPCNTVINAVPSVSMPTAARARSEGGFKAARRAMVRYFSIGALVMAPYLLFLVIWPQGIMMALYRKNAASYLQYTTLARVNVIAIGLGYVANSLGTFLQALEETRYQFITSIANTAAVLVIGLPLTYFGGLWGTLLGCIICVSVRGGCNLLFLNRVKNKPTKPLTHEPIVLPGAAAEAGITTAESTAITPN